MAAPNENYNFPITTNVFNQDNYLNTTNSEKNKNKPINTEVIGNQRAEIVSSVPDISATPIIINTSSKKENSINVPSATEAKTNNVVTDISIQNSKNIVNSSMQSLTNDEVLELWDSTVDFVERDKIVAELQRRDLFPSNAMAKWEYESGAYPDIRDPEFLQKLLAKREFAESLQTTWKPRSDPCEDDASFEVTPVQRFVANFMSPKTPYMSALLFHGVGVGKTCAAVQIIEAWLETFPRNEVFLVAPPTIQQGFFRTIFDITKVVIGEGNEPNTASQCTGVTYMKLTNTLYERDIKKIEKAVNKSIRRRYKVFG
jgi:hypothetical protein